MIRADELFPPFTITAFGGVDDVLASEVDRFRDQMISSWHQVQHARFDLYSVIFCAKCEWCDYMMKCASVIMPAGLTRTGRVVQPPLSDMNRVDSGLIRAVLERRFYMDAERGNVNGGVTAMRSPALFSSLVRVFVVRPNQQNGFYCTTPSCMERAKKESIADACVARQFDEDWCPCCEAVSIRRVIPVSARSLDRDESTEMRVSVSDAFEWLASGHPSAEDNMLGASPHPHIPFFFALTSKRVTACALCRASASNMAAVDERLSFRTVVSACSICGLLSPTDQVLAPQLGDDGRRSDFVRFTSVGSGLANASAYQAARGVHRARLPLVSGSMRNVMLIMDICSGCRYEGEQLFRSL